MSTVFPAAPEAEGPGRRHQRPRGDRHPNWRGAEASVEAKHFRVITARGKPASCIWGCADAKRYEWANLTGDYDDIWDYAAMCAKCHRKYDNARRSMEPGFTRHPWGYRGLFTADQVRELRRRAADGERPAALAREYGIAGGTMGSLIRGDKYAWVVDP
jgi:hypothetical protein